MLYGVRDKVSHPYKTTAKIILFIHLNKTDYSGNCRWQTHNEIRPKISENILILVFSGS
jgi:hypothetical protein